MNKIFLLFLSLTFVPIVWFFAIFANLLNVYFDKGFYVDQLPKPLYEDSKLIIVNKFLQSSETLNANSKDVFENFLDKNYKLSQLEDILEKAVDDVSNYKKGSSLIISLSEIKLHIEKAVRDFLRYYNVKSNFDIDAYITKHSLNFYEYIPSQIVLDDTNFKGSNLNAMSLLFTENTYLQLFLFCVFSVITLITFFSIASKYSDRFKYTGIVFLSSGLINIFLVIIFFKSLDVFLNKFYIKFGANDELGISKNLYYVLFDKFEYSTLLTLIVFCIISALAIIYGIVSEPDSVKLKAK